MTNYTTPDLIAQLRDELMTKIDDLQSQIDMIENRKIKNYDKMDGEILAIFTAAPGMLFDRKMVSINMGEQNTSSATYQRIVRRLSVLSEDGKLQMVSGDASRPIHKLA